LKTGPVEFLFSKTFEGVLGLKQLPIQLVLFAPPAGVRPESELYRFPACSAEVKDDWGYACTFSCAFMVRTDADFFSCNKYEGISWWTVLPLWLTSVHPREQNCASPRAILPLLIRDRAEDDISRRLPWNVTQAFGVRSQRLTASAVARTQMLWLW